jgi:hypothetical protein
MASLRHESATEVRYVLSISYASRNIKSCKIRQMYIAQVYIISLDIFYTTLRTSSTCLMFFALGEKIRKPYASDYQEMPATLRRNPMRQSN